MLAKFMEGACLLALLTTSLVSAGAIDYAVDRTNTDAACQRYCEGYKDYIDYSDKELVSRARLGRYGSNEPRAAQAPPPPPGAPGSPGAPCVCSQPTGSLGCWYEGTRGRALPLQYIAPDMTVAKCAAYCAAYAFYGLEYADECYCGNAIINGAYQTEASACDTPCGGNSSQVCGGNNLLSIYQSNVPGGAGGPAPYTYAAVGCYAEPAQGRALQRVIASTQQTLEGCFGTCSNGQFAYAGLETGQECWCGNALNPAATPVAASYCDMPCPGNSSQICGGPLALSLYSNTTAVFPRYY